MHIKRSTNAIACGRFGGFFPASAYQNSLRDEFVPHILAHSNVQWQWNFKPFFWIFLVHFGHCSEWKWRVRLHWIFSDSPLACSDHVTWSSLLDSFAHLNTTHFSCFSRSLILNIWTAGFCFTTCGISSSLHACMKSNSRDSHCNGVIHIIIILRVDLMNRCLSESFWFYHSACDFSFHVIRHYLKRSDFNVIFILFIYVDWKAKSIIRISEKTTTSRVVVMKMTVSNKKILLFEAYSTTYYSSSLTAIKIAIWFE